VTRSPSTIWLHVTLPHSIDCAPDRVAQYPQLVREALAHGSRTVKIQENDPDTAAVLAVPGAMSVKYFREEADPYWHCAYDRIGLGCRHKPSCSE